MKVVFVTQDFIVLILGSKPSVSVEIYSFCPRVFVWVPRLTGRYRLWALLGSKKFYKMQARVMHRVHMARGLSQAVSCHILFPCVASEICELSFSDGLCKLY